MQANVPALAPIAVAIENVPAIVGVSRTRIFEAVRNSELSARKAGRSTIIEVDELRRWVKSLPMRVDISAVRDAA